MWIGSVLRCNRPNILWSNLQLQASWRWVCDTDSSLCSPTQAQFSAIVFCHYVTRGRATTKLGGADSSEFDRFLLHLFTWFLLRFARFSFLTNPYNAKAKKLCFSNVIYRIGALSRGSGRICVQKGRIQHLPPIYTRPKPSRDVDPAWYDRSRGAAVVPCSRTICRRLHRLNTSTSREGPRAIRDIQKPPPPLPVIIRRPDLKRRRPRRSSLRSPSISSPPLLIA